MGSDFLDMCFVCGIGDELHICFNKELVWVILLGLWWLTMEIWFGNNNEGHGSRHVMDIFMTGP
jgi:hypothetical protein